MTIGKVFSEMGLGNKQLNERLSHTDFGTSAHDPHMIYAYEPPSHAVHHVPVASSKHHHGGGGHKSNAAMSALTLLAFLFFLNILQQCLKEHMMAMSTPQVVVMTAGREGDHTISKAKTDKPTASIEARRAENEKANDNSFSDEYKKDILMKINTEEHTPKDTEKYKYMFKKDYDTRNSFPGFVSAMDEK